jgi:hypothetical protein
MPQALRLAEANLETIAKEIPLPLKDVQAMLQHFTDKSYIITDIPDGDDLLWMTVHENFFRARYCFTAPEKTQEFVEIREW